MRGKKFVCSLGALHYIAAIIVLLDSIIFMFGFSPFIITKLAPAVYYSIITYSITAGSLLYCQPKLASIRNKGAKEKMISRRQLKARRRKRRLTPIPNKS